MDRIDEYVNKLDHLKVEAKSLIDEVKNSENLLENLMDSTCKVMKNAYIQEANRIIDEMTQHRLHMVETEESRLGSVIAKQAMGILEGVLRAKAGESELARRAYEGAGVSYRMDETRKAKIGYASEIVKRRVKDEVLEMKREEFMRSLKGGRTMRKMFASMFDEEVARTPPPGTQSSEDVGYNSIRRI